MWPARVDRGILQASLAGLILAVGTWSAAGAIAEAPSASSEATGSDAALEKIQVQGEGLYIKNCRQCHGTNGSSGVPLAGNHRISDPNHVVHVIINGPRYMPAFGGFLSDDEIAAVATYVLTSWGNEFGAVTADDVANWR